MTPIALRQVRYALEMQQDEFAEMLGYKGSAMVSHMEKGKARIPLWVELQLNNILDKRIAALGQNGS
jgi:DNA-binding transcriptional regulator YiaG